MSKVSIEVTQDEALVLYGWLAEQKQVVDEGSAEQRVLWDLESSLEAILVEPLQDDYQQLLNDAKKRVLGE